MATTPADDPDVTPVVNATLVASHDDGESANISGSYWWPQMPSLQHQPFSVQVPNAYQGEPTLKIFGAYHSGDQDFVVQFVGTLGERADNCQTIYVDLDSPTGPGDVPWPIDMLIFFILDYSDEISINQHHRQG